MNALSLAYSNAQKQQQEKSWSENPFNFNGFVTGVTKISDHKRNLRDYALEMVGSYGEFIGNQYELNLEKLSSPYQLEFARLYIESIDREIEWACYGEDQTLNSDFLCAMLAMLRDNNPDTREKFAQVTAVNILTYYKNTLQEIIDNACHDYYQNEMHESGYHSEQDTEHGDFFWSKS